jgi:hypothetical protein
MVVERVLTLQACRRRLPSVPTATGTIRRCELAVQQKLTGLLKSDMEQIMLKVRMPGVHAARAILPWSGARQNRVSSHRVQIMLLIAAPWMYPRYRDHFGPRCHTYLIQQRGRRGRVRCKSLVQTAPWPCMLPQVSALFKVPGNLLTLSRDKNSNRCAVFAFLR